MLVEPAERRAAGKADDPGSRGDDDEIAEAGGMVVAPDKAESIADGLADFLDRLRAGRIGPPDETVVARYDARPIAAAFDRLVASLSN